MTIRIKVAPQPAVIRNGADTRYVTNRERTISGTSQAVALDDNSGSETVDLGPSVFGFQPPEISTIKHELADGNVRTAVVAPRREVLTINLQPILPANQKALDRLLRTGRPLSIGAWYDHTTQIMSHCAGQDRITGGVTEVGWSNPTNVIRRDGSNTTEEDHWDHPVAGPAWLQNGLWSGTYYRPKVVAGMIGRAFQFDRGKIANLASPRKTTSNGTAANQIFPPANKSGTAEIVITSEDVAPFYPGALGTFSTHVAMPASSTHANFVYSNTQTVANGTIYTLSLLVRGTGTISLAWNEGTTDILRSARDLSGEWEWHVLTFTASATSGTFRVYAGSPSGTVSACQFEVHLAQIEANRSRTAFMDYSTNPLTEATDALVFEENLATPFTFICYFKFVNDDEDKPLLFYTWAGGGTDNILMISVRGDDFILQSPSGSNMTWTDALTGVTNGSWIAVHLTFKAAVSANTWWQAELYINGVSKGSQNNSALDLPLAADVITTTGFIYIGGEAALFSGNTAAANTAIDCFRIDRRIWTATEVADDYETRSDVGMQVFLARVQGRYFEPENVVGPRAVFTDIFDGQIRLRQAGFNPASAT